MELLPDSPTTPGPETEWGAHVTDDEYGRRS